MDFILAIWKAYPPLRFVFGGLLGAILGSFLNVCISRWPQGRSVICPRSSCEACGLKLKFFHNIPVMSYLWLKGLCSECHQPIGFRHFLVEVLMGVMGIYYLGCYPNIEGGVGFCFMALLLTGALVDWETFSLPAPLLGLGFLLGSVWVGFFSDNPISLTAYTSLTEGLLACVAVSGVLLWLGLCFEIIFKKPALGLGDVYWLGIIALFSGPLGAIFSLFFGAFLGLIFIMIAFLLEKLFKVRIGPRLPVDEVLKESFSVEEDRKVDLGLNIAVPFGPWLSLAAAIYFNFIQKYSLLFIEKLHFLIDHYHLLF